MIRHHHESMDLHAAFPALCLEDAEEEQRMCFHLKDAATLRSYRNNVIGPEFLRSLVHLGRISHTNRD